METAMDVAAWLAKIVVESSIGTLTSSAIKQLKLDPAMNDALLGLNASLRKLETQLKCLLKRLKEAAGDAADGLKYEEVKKMVGDGGDPSKKRKRPNLVSSSLDHLLNDPSTVKVKEIQKRLDEMTAAIEQVVSISSAIGAKEAARAREKRDGFITAEDRTSSSRVLFECKTCNRQFQSFQALGGHRASHKKMKNKSAAATKLGFVDHIRSDKHHQAVPAKPKIVGIGRLYQTAMDERVEEEFRSAFDMFDENGDGFVTADKLRSVVASIGLKQGQTVEDCRRMIRKVGVDGDGKVNFKEFKQTMRRDGFAVL